MLVTYRQNGSLRPGFTFGAEVADVQGAAELAGWDEASRAVLSSARSVVALGSRLDELRELAEGRAEELRDRGALLALGDLSLGPPVPDPQKIVCLGLNYSDHAAEAGLDAPSAPMFFAKYPNSLSGPADAIVPPRHATGQIDYEGELALVIGKRAHGISGDEALEHLAGAMAFNDVSARDLQLANALWTGGKAIDSFAPCGPGLVPLEEIGDLQSLAVRTRVNGETVQDGNTASMIFGVAEIVAFLSRIMTLEPGDVIATGTPAGVGMSREPQLWLDAGDLVEVEIESLGTLRNRVAAPA